MADRSVTVKLKIDNSDFIRGLAASASAAKAFERSLGDGTARFGSSLGDAGDEAQDFSEHLHTATDANKDFQRSSTQVVSATNRQGAAFRKATSDQRGFLASLNTSNDRMSFLVQTSLALGPALIPAFAALTPVVTGFGSALGFSAAASVGAVIAFQGVGDALTAINDFDLDPTSANLEKMTRAMSELGPAGQEFVLFLHDLNPELEKLQSAAQAGLFPGLTEGIEQVMEQAPLVEQVIKSLTDIAGDIASDTGGALTSPFWTQFLEFLRDEGRQIMTDFASGIGHVIEGLAALAQAFHPLSEDFIGGFDDMAQSFSAWAQGLSETGGFQDFVAYIREAGPEFIDVLAAAGEAIVALARAGDQIGLASLEVLQRALEGIAAVLESPIGPPLLAIAAAMSALARAVALMKIASFASVGAGLSGLATGIIALTAATTGSGFSKAGPFARLAVLGTGMQALAKVPWAGIAGGITLLAASFTDADDQLGVDNTVAFGSIGALFGPIGIAVGGAIGALKDMEDANDDAIKSIENIGDVLRASPLDWKAQDQAIADAQASVQGFNDNLVDLGLDDYYKALIQPSSLLQTLPAVKDKIEGIFGDSDSEELAQDAQEQADAVQQVRDAYADLANAFVGKPVFEGTLSDLPEITAELERMAPAMDAVGVTQEELVRLSTSKGLGGVFDKLALAAYVTELNAYDEAANGTLGSTRRMVVAFDDVANASEAETAAIAAAVAQHNALADALTGSIEGMIAFRDAVRAAIEGAKGFDGNIFSGTKAADEQLTNLLKVKQAWNDQEPAAQAAVGAYKEARREFIRVARAMDVPIERARQLANNWLDLPDPALQAAAAAKKLAREYNSLPKQVRTEIAALGADASRADVKALAREYDLTPKQVKTILEAQDDATVKIKGVRAEIEETDGDTATVNVEANTDAAISAAQSAVAFINGLVASIFVGVTGPGASGAGAAPGDFRQTPGGATGGWISGPGTETSDSIPALLSNNEFVVNAKSAKRFASVLQWINAQKFASGGFAFAKGGNVTPRELTRRAFTADDPTTLQQLARAFKEMAAEARDVAEAERDLHAARENSKEANHAVKDSEKALEKARREAGDKVSDDEKARIKELEERLRKREKAQRVADKQQAQAEKELSRQRDQLAEATDRWKQKQQELIDQAKAIQDAVQSAGAIFGGEGTSVTVGGILAKIRDAAKKGREFNRNIAEIRAAGLDPRLVDQLLEAAGTPEGWAAAENLANASRRQIRNLNAAQGRLERVSRASGEFGFTRGGGGVHVEARFTGPITTTDVKGLDKKLEKRVLRAVKLARQK